jgi:hypothetical protein
VFATGRVSLAQATMLARRREEGNQRLWAIATQMDEPVRSYVARLFAIEDALVALAEGPP